MGEKRAWGEDNAKKWRQIVDDATKRPLDLGTQDEVDSAFGISSELSEIGQSVSHECNQVYTTMDGTKPAEPPPGVMQCHKLSTERIMDQDILPQKYVDVRYDKDYVSVGPTTVNRDIETQLYKGMVKVAVTLNKSHQHARGITSSAKVLGQLEMNDLGLKTLTGEGSPAFLANILFDGGSGGGLLKKEVSQFVNLPRLEP